MKIKYLIYASIVYRTIKNVFITAKNCIYYHNKYSGVKSDFNLAELEDAHLFEYIVCKRNDYMETIIFRSIGIIIGGLILILIIFFIFPNKPSSTKEVKQNEVINK